MWDFASVLIATLALVVSAISLFLGYRADSRATRALQFQEREFRADRGLILVASFDQDQDAMTVQPSRSDVHVSQLMIFAPEKKVGDQFVFPLGIGFPSEAFGFEYPLSAPRRLAQELLAKQVEDAQDQAEHSTGFEGFAVATIPLLVYVQYVAEAQTHTEVSVYELRYVRYAARGTRGDLSSIRFLSLDFTRRLEEFDEPKDSLLRILDRGMSFRYPPGEFVSTEAVGSTR